ncbi:MAG: hypothetical protein CSA62_08705 [Planctomycetota bacterium]|nr:MAG: hypothetical protein CSA62_08705 [Planctomycetota bacterium]
MKQFSLGVLLGVLSTFSATAQSDAPGQDEDLAPILQASPEHGLPGTVPGTERWIVHFKKRSFDLTAFRQAVRDGADAQTVRRIIEGYEEKVISEQRPFELALEKIGGSMLTQWWLVNACLVQLPFARLSDLRALPGIAFVQPEELHEIVIKKATNAQNHNSDYVNQSLKSVGLGVTAAIMDTGQDEDVGGSGRPHKTYFVNGDPQNKTGGGIGGSRLLVNRRIGALGPDDPHGHGTGVASIAAGANWGMSAADNGHAPMAGIAGYAIANRVSGGSSSNSTMASAWQKMASDKVQYNIVAANLSYGGSPNPLDIAQKALDSAVLNADIMVCVAAGNSRSSTRGSQSAVNGLAVGAVSADSHRVASFSSRGFLYGDSQRFYPDIAACGVRTVMARRDNESGTYVGSGTSMASPQVCGAATVLRGKFSKLTALETKAILLASTLDISEQNPSAPYNSRNAYGMGYLRDDRAFALASASQFGTAKLDTKNKVWTQKISVKAKKTYAIAIAWHRSNLSSTQWSDLALDVLDGQSVIASSDTPRNLYEMLRVYTKSATQLTLRVRAKSFGSTQQDFSFAWMEAPNSKQPGSFVTFGKGCAGSGLRPSKCASLNETSSLRGNRGYPNITYLLEFRPQSNLELSGFRLKMKSRGQGTLTLPTYLYSSTQSGQPDKMLASGTMSVGTSSKHYATTLNKTVKLAAKQLYFIGFRNHSSTITVGTAWGGSIVPYWRNNGSGGSWIRFTTRSWSYIIDCKGGPGAVPQIASSALPEIGRSYDLKLSFAASQIPVLAWTGFSDSSYNTLPLPFSLSPLGAKGCWLLCSGELLLPTATSAAGVAAVPFVIPNAKDLMGTRYYQQWLLFDNKANSFGLVTSAAASLRLGGRP